MTFLPFFKKSAQEKKSPPLRGPKGKFISRKTPTQVPGKKPSPKPKKKPDSTKSLKPQGPYKASFYAKTIRRFYCQKQCYFVIDDILSLASEFGSHQEFENLKNKIDAENKLEKIIKQISYQENNQAKTLECATVEGVKQIIPMLHQTFPGPLSRWLREVAKQTSPSFTPPKKITPV